MIRRTFRRPLARRGAILLVVLGMLALFAVVGLSFVLYAESEATGARNNRAARNELADPDPISVANQFLAQMIFDTDANSPLWGHSLARSRFGPAGGQSPFTGTGFPFGTSVTLNGATMDQTQVVNYSAANAFGGTSPDTWNKAVPWTYPDRNNYHLAYYDPVTDQVTLPSFYRKDLFGVLDPPGTATANPNWTNADGRFKILRPRPAEHPAFPTVAMNADGTYTGDVSNLKFLTGNQKNDSLWMDLNLPIKEWRGKRYKAMVAPLVLDLGGKIDLRVAGNNRGAGGASGSNAGWGPWEVTPNGVLGGSAADTAALVNLRQTGANPAGAATPMDRFRGLSTGTLNGGRMTAQYARIDASGTGTGGPDAMALPGAGLFSPFPNYNTGAGGTSRFAGSQSNVAVPPTLDSQLAATHGQSISPWQWGRRQTPTTGTPWMPSLEDQLRLDLRTGGPKGATGYAGQFSPNGKLTTLFSASQRWGEITVPTATGTAKLVAIDLTRPLPDYRVNTTVVLSPANMTPATVTAAQLARQNLARDIFVRIIAALGQIDGTNVAYDPLTANVVIGYAPGTPQFSSLRQFAQYAVNMVEQIDVDDISTPFTWNTAVPTDIVFGTELPKLVLNEAYCGLFNNRIDLPMPPLNVVTMKRPAQQPHKKMFWIELHNPLTTDPTLADGGAARLQYDPATTLVQDQTGAAVAAPFTSSIYQVDVAEVAAAVPDKTPLTTALGANPSNVALDTAAIPGTTARLRIGTYTYDATAPSPPATLGGDQFNLVLPSSGVSPGTQGRNEGYYVIGPKDNFPTPGVTTTLRLPDDVPPAPHNAAMYSQQATALDNAGVTAALGSTHVVILRRLANPYLPVQPLPAVVLYNPYIVVDFLENVPTRDRAEFDSTDRRAGFTASASPTVGRRHPYAAAPTYGAANAAVVDQTQVPAPMPAPTTPTHTFFAANNANNPANLDNAAGLAWLAHLDREPVNQLELLMTGVQSPALLTQKFSNGPGIYQRHVTLAATGIPVPLDPAFPTFHRAYDLLSVGSRLPGIPLGGREPGRVNINTAGDAAILQAVLDPQSGNTFAQNPAFTPAIAWAQLLASRTPAGTPAATVWEGAAAGDRPFQPGGSLYLDSLLRQGAPNVPVLFSYGPGTNGHPSMYSEPARKGWNNLTTVSDGFLVAFTVGFFEWSPPGFPNTLGKEIYDKVPGDLRAQYAGIVDRTALTLDIDPTTLAVRTGTFGPKPWETKLAADGAISSTTITIQAQCPAGATTCTVFDDGNPIVIDATGAAPSGTRTSQLWVGYAMANPTNLAFANPPYTTGTPQAADGDGEVIKVTAVAPGPTPGTAVLTFSTATGGTALTRFHGGNSRVSNAAVGHPGPQPAFDYRESTGKYRGVLPFFMRMVP